MGVELRFSVPVYRGGAIVYAIIETGGKQYRVKEGDVVAVEKLPQAEGEAVIFDRVVHVSSEQGVKIGQPYLEGCSVKATVLKHEKARKVMSIRYRPKKNIRRRRGHRQWYTLVEIDRIDLGESS